MIHAPTWDLFIGLFFIIGVSYGFILQREKVVITLISIYAALVATQIISPFALGFFDGDKTVGSIFVKANVSPFTVQTAVFGLTIILLTVRSGLVGRSGRGLLSPFEVAIFSLLNSALILTTVLYFLPDEVRGALADQSRFAKIIIERHDIWTIAPVITLIVLGFRHSRNDDYYE